jgi:hypothetical protein
MLSDALVREYARITKDSFGIAIDETEAREQAERLFAYFSMLVEWQRAEAVQDQPSAKYEYNP